MAGREEMTWQEALAVNNGDYAYAPDGGMLLREDDETFTVRSGKWEERSGLSEAQIPGALKALKMSSNGWTYE